MASRLGRSEFGHCLKEGRMCHFPSVSYTHLVESRYFLEWMMQPGCIIYVRIRGPRRGIIRTGWCRRIFFPCFTVPCPTTDQAGLLVYSKLRSVEEAAGVSLNNIKVAAYQDGYKGIGGYGYCHYLFVTNNSPLPWTASRSSRLA